MQNYVSPDLYMPIANVAIVISDFQQKCVVLKAMRRSGSISKDLLMKN